MKDFDVNCDPNCPTDEFEALNELEDDEDPLGVILAYGADPVGCW